MRIVVTGGDGFIGRNLRVRLAEAGQTDVVNISRDTGQAARREALVSAEFIFHLAGVNRPKDVTEFEEGNAEATRQVCHILRAAGRQVPIAFSSSTQATLDNPYGRSKLAAEAAIQNYGREVGEPFYVVRLTNVFGKWAKPNYNSAVATFCNNIARGLPITINDASAPLDLVYVDDVVDAMIELLGASVPSGFFDIGPVHRTTVGEVASIIQSFAESRQSLVTPRVGVGLVRALHATYLSYLAPDDFAYGLERRADPRGAFVEMLKTVDSGQFSYFTVKPGMTRGGHYHHTKAEKFLVVVGRGRFRFEHIVTGERFELSVDANETRVVETVPGWAHDITNVGDGEMVVLLWANEVFDSKHADTIAFTIDS